MYLFVRLRCTSRRLYPSLTPTQLSCATITARAHCSAPAASGPTTCNHECSCAGCLERARRAEPARASNASSGPAAGARVLFGAATWGCGGSPAAFQTLSLIRCDRLRALQAAAGVRGAAPRRGSVSHCGGPGPARADPQLLQGRAATEALDEPGGAQGGPDPGPAGGGGAEEKAGAGGKNPVPGGARPPPRKRRAPGGPASGDIGPIWPPAAPRERRRMLGFEGGP